METNNIEIEEYDNEETRAEKMNNITSHRQRLLDIHVEYLQHEINGFKTNQTLAEESLTKLYELTGAEPPTFTWIEYLGGKSGNTANTEVVKHLRSMGVVTQDDFATYRVEKFAQGVLGVKNSKEEQEIIEMYINVAKSCFWYRASAGVCQVMKHKN